MVGGALPDKWYWRPDENHAWRGCYLNDLLSNTAGSPITSSRESKPAEAGEQENAEWKGLGCCIHLPDGAIICADDGVKANDLRRYHNKVVASLLARLQKAEADMKRLDWVLKNINRVPVAGTFYFDSIPNGKLVTREAIDAATKAEPNEKK